MNINQDDRMIRDFFQQNKKAIEDDAFTEKVMRKLPVRRKNYDWIIVLFSAVGALIAGLLAWNNRPFIINISLPDQFTWYYLLVGISIFPFLVLLFYELQDNGRINRI